MPIQKSIVDECILIDKTNSKAEAEIEKIKNEINSNISKYFTSPKPLKIKDLELVDIKNAGPLLLKQIAEKSVLLYEIKKDSFPFYNFKIYAFKIFMESKRLFDLQKLSFNKFLQKI